MALTVRLAGHVHRRIFRRQTFLVGRVHDEIVSDASAEPVELRVVLVRFVAVAEDAAVNGQIINRNRRENEIRSNNRRTRNTSEI